MVTAAQQPAISDLAKARQYTQQAETALTSVRYPGDNDEVWSRAVTNAGHLAQLSLAFSTLAYVEIVNREIERQEGGL